MTKAKPTFQAYDELQKAYDFFNRRLYGDTLPDCLLTLQRKKAAVLGYFSPKRFTSVEGETDELAMNPAHFHIKSIEDVLAVLVHEQAHVWQQHHGKPGRGKYHNKEWGKKMKEIGLHPSNTGAPGGKETGDQMVHYVIKGGNFERASRELIAQDFRLSWAEDGPKPVDNGEPIGEGQEEEKKEKDKSNRHKYTCPQCGMNAWGKPEIELMCGKCRINLIRKGK